MGHEVLAGAATCIDAQAALQRSAAAFRRPRGAALADLVAVGPVQADALPSVELRVLRITAFGSLTALAGGAAAGTGGLTS